MKSSKKTFADKILGFYQALTPPMSMPKGVEALNPYQNRDTRALTKLFFEKYYADTRPRVLVIGINPGRLGGGATGIGFSDPVALEQYCGIQNTFPKKRELSSEFVYRFIEEWGGPEKFYQNFFFTAVSPLGFVKEGVNYNYYDDSEFAASIRSYVTSLLETQIAFGARTEAAIVLGTGKNFKYLNSLNDEHAFFKRLYPIEHPRFIMQYRRKRLPEYLAKYHEVFSAALKPV